MKDRIKILRKSLGLNQADFGSRVGVKGNTIGNYEVGLRNPSDAVIFSICREFNVDENWLRTGEGEMFKQISVEQQTYMKFGEIMEGADDTKRNLLTMMIKLLHTLPDETWDYVCTEFENCIIESKKKKNDH